MKIAAILLAAGTGSRARADIPKQFWPLAGRPVMAWAAQTLAAHCALLQPVGKAAAIEAALGEIPHLPPVPGGATRQESVRHGLRALAPYQPDYVLVHDAARPVIPNGTIEALLAALKNHHGAIPAAPVAETLKHVQNGVIGKTVPRENLYRAQTPQAFHFATLAALHEAAENNFATDDAALLEVAGIAVAIVTGSEQNIKITYPEDFARVENALLPKFLPRTGNGFDVHAVAQNRDMVICGIKIPCDFGLAGHSDADVGIHALCDAIYGALAEGDIGRHFPPSDDQWKNMDSARFLTHAASRIAARGAIFCNADITLICERPKITPHAPAMIARLAMLLNVPAERISVKATTTEKLGFTGRGEGIAAQASVSLLVPLQ